MGITGLLPALRPIHKTKRLDEFRGKRIAVDAYVWIHKGTYSCAADLATGKQTIKYVDYCMGKINILRHSGIEPYIVFDGGPLPAKKGTESDRKKKRDEYLAKAKTLSAQGRHKEARDCYNKCVDVTPQMAFQFIKALKAANVSYVVAPFEADAQLAYLERIGVVDGVMTEDSDLLVFGCKTVLLKFDASAFTVVCIEREDFGNVAPPQSDISLINWTDAQFRSMAILSGCDYLPSITGIGLKTACTLLRKWNSAEQVIRVLRLEGKKSVPVDYLEQFKLAEMCFQHQKVYCPLEEKLVPLKPIPADWKQEYEDYCGGSMEPGMAQRIAKGDVDPTTLLPMVDINPAFQPSSKQAIQQAGKQPHSKGKAPETRAAGLGRKVPATKPVAGKGGLFDFFGPNAIIPSSKPLSDKQPRTAVVAGQASGKRTLAEVMDSEMARKKQRKKRESTPLVTHSKFFGGLERSRRHSIDVLPHPPRILEEEKENVDPEDMDEADASDLSVAAQARFTSEVDLDFDEDMAEVAQEDGYMSPLALYSPSPVVEGGDVAKTSQSSQEQDDDDDFGAAAFSSPTSTKKNRHRSCSLRFSSPINPNDSPPTFPRVTRVVLQREDAVLEEEDTPVARRLFVNAEAGPSRLPVVALDLRSTLGVGNSTTEVDFVEEPDLIVSSSSSPECSPDTPVNLSAEQEPAVVDIDDLEEPDLVNMEDQRLREIEESRATAVQGWMEKFSHNPKATAKGKAVAKDQPMQAKARVSMLKRSNTNVTPAGRHSLASSAKGKSKASMADTPSISVLQKKKSVSTIKKKSAMATVNFFQPKRIDSVPRAPIYVPDSDDEIVVGSSPVMARMYHQIDTEEVAVSHSESRLSQFRYGK